MSVRFKRGIGRLAAMVLVALASCSGDLPNTAWRGGPGERGYSAGAATPIVDLIRERDIRPPDQTAAVPLLEQLRRELAKSDPAGTFAGITYDLTAGNRLPSGWLLQSPTRWGRRAADLPLYPLDCKDCEPDVLLPACRQRCRLPQRRHLPTDLAGASCTVDPPQCLLRSFRRAPAARARPGRGRPPQRRHRCPSARPRHALSRRPARRPRRPRSKWPTHRRPSARGAVPAGWRRCGGAAVIAHVRAARYARRAAHRSVSPPCAPAPPPRRAGVSPGRMPSSS